MKIFKYTLKHEILQEIEMPNHALIRHVGLQNEKICLWAEVDEKNIMIKKTFYLVGTGHPIPAQAKYYLGTVQQPPFVWHIYE